ncbi:MAG: hypothetical protein HC829_08300, partial [Bacteroidales bacterium]|nr:hypothetical protein [Bacteroidales bacterium]
EFLHDNPGIEFYPSDYVNDPFTIARHNRMVTMNRALAIDITGQVLAEAMPQTLLAGISGIPDFVRGARGSKGGKSIIFLPSTTRDGKKSNIIPSVAGETVVVRAGDVPDFPTLDAHLRETQAQVRAAFDRILGVTPE